MNDITKRDRLNTLIDKKYELIGSITVKLDDMKIDKEILINDRNEHRKDLEELKERFNSLL